MGYVTAIHLYVTDLDYAIDFYSRLLGYGPQAAFITELFPTRIRYSGVSIAYQLTSIFAGSLAPIIALWLYKESGSATPVAIYVAIACAISGISALLAKETKGTELDAIR